MPFVCGGFSVSIGTSLASALPSYDLCLAGLSSKNNVTNGKNGEGLTLSSLFHLSASFLTIWRLRLKLMQNADWAIEIQSLDTWAPQDAMDKEKLYTVHMKDFLRMPDLNFEELAFCDPLIRALMN